MSNEFIGPKYPAPDRSNFERNQFVDDDQMPERDLGSRTGALSNGRPFHLEAWATEGMTLVTVFFSVIGIKSATPDELLQLVLPVLDQEGVPEEKRKIAPKEVLRIKDAKGNEMYSLTFVVGEPEF